MFPGPIDRVVRGCTDQFIAIPVGMLSLAEYSDRHGYKVSIDNIGDRMVSDPDFDVENHLRRAEAKIYGIDLHWAVHSQGAIEIARLCKRFHPEALVVVGGLTATCFHLEILQKYWFIDAVVRGEAEKSFLQLVEVFERRGGSPLFQMLLGVRVERLGWSL